MMAETESQVTFFFTPVQEVHVREILTWQYDPPYHIYNPGSGDVENDVRYFLDPQTNCYALIGWNGELVAYCTFGRDARVPGGDYRTEALDMGLGVRPDLTGQGRGIVFARAVLEFVRERFAPVACRVTVAAFNQRARRVWEKAGFRRIQAFRRTKDGMPFVILAYESPSLPDSHTGG
jgi:ribosomal-protein-alanine N-acetyltransferase